MVGYRKKELPAAGDHRPAFSPGGGGKHLFLCFGPPLLAGGGLSGIKDGAGSRQRDPSEAVDPSLFFFGKFFKFSAGGFLDPAHGLSSFSAYIIA